VRVNARKEHYWLDAAQPANQTGQKRLAPAARPQAMTTEFVAIKYLVTDHFKCSFH